MTLSIAIDHRLDGFSMTLDFKAPSGVTAVFGRSGAGKSTLINAVAGLVQPRFGRIVLQGRTVLDTNAGINLPPHKRRIGYVFQDARLFPHLSVHQNLTFGRWFAPKSPSGPPFDHVVEMLGIGALLQRRPGDLSGGERQRVALGRAILSNPSLLALDEPLAALDENRKAEILPYLERMRDELRLPILYVSHSMAEIARLADTLVLLDRGRLVAAGPITDLLSDPALAPGFGPREAGALITATLAAHEDDGLSRLDCTAGPLYLPRIAAPIGAPVRIHIMASDVMLALTPPRGISALNVLPAIIKDIRQGDGPGALVQLDASGARILARITRRSAQALALRPGLAVHAILKAVSVAQENIGHPAPEPD